MGDRAKNRGWIWCLAVVSALILASVATPAEARDPRKTHTVKAGDSVAKIADFYGVSQRDLMELNRLRKGKPLRLGQELRIPNVLRVSGKKYKVKKGDSLGSIAAKFKRTIREIAHANKLKDDAVLIAGRTIVIPDKGSSTADIKVKGRTIKPIRFLRVRSGERIKIQLYNSKGKLLKGNVWKLSKLCRDAKSGKVQRLNFRLVEMIQRLAEAYPDKTIEIMSGYRPTADGTESQHAFGRAVDIRIAGVPTKELYNFCKKLPRSGCGYYPNDGFIHMDARERKTTWVGK